MPAYLNHLEQTHRTALRLGDYIKEIRLEIIEVEPVSSLFAGSTTVRVLSEHKHLFAAGRAMNKLPSEPEAKKGEKGLVRAPYARISYRGYHNGFKQEITFICAYHNLPNR
jgi:hypothetical protein